MCFDFEENVYRLHTHTHTVFHFLIRFFTMQFKMWLEVNAKEILWSKFDNQFHMMELLAKVSKNFLLKQ